MSAANSNSYDSAVNLGSGLKYLVAGMCRKERKAKERRQECARGLCSIRATPPPLTVYYTGVFFEKLQQTYKTVGVSSKITRIPRAYILDIRKGKGWRGGAA